MKIYISSFYNVRFFTSNMIPIGTAGNWPFWIYQHYNQPKESIFFNENNVLLGMKEKLFADSHHLIKDLTEMCGEKPCPYLEKVPHCQFMDKYYNYLCEHDFPAFIDRLSETAEYIRSVIQFEGEAIIVLLVYESEKCICAERPCIKQWFADNGYKLKEWNKSLLSEGDVF